MPLSANQKARRKTARSPHAIEDAELRELLIRHTERVADLCRFARIHQRKPEFPCRDYLSHLHREAAHLEELVDGHGAQNNEKWFPFRETMAAAKLFSSVTYEILHIQHFVARYSLTGADYGLPAATREVVDTLRDALLSCTEEILEQLERCGLRPTEEDQEPRFRPCKTETLSYTLAADRAVRHSDKVGETVVYLATQFLNLSEDHDVKEVFKKRAAESYPSFIPEPISEERLRLVESRFHNLQSLYDTYIFESDMEKQNEDLPTLRGHISLIYHFLVVATNLAHYYTRHMSSLRRETVLQTRFPLAPEALPALLFDYPLYYARCYLESAVNLCREMIRAYSEETTVDVPIPNYRGFHVRPSTLVAKIVRHYGSPVSMELDGREYDAALPFDLFRANEAINAAKRRRVADMLDKHRELHVSVPDDPGERTRELQLLFVRLMNEGAIVLYDTNLAFGDIDPQEGETLAELASRYLAHLMSMAKMDIRSDITVRFRGDSRALNDLSILAHNGYGEDDIGNNIVLPEELSYLSR